jgi:predicted TIM-barrel fold metal-dependent hydrolase
VIVEWNAHMFSSDVGRYPFHPQAAYTPDAARFDTDPLAAYLRRMDEVGIDHAVLVHPEPYGDDHRLVLDCLQREPDRLRGTSLFYPKDPGAADKLGHLVERHPRIVATRFHAHRGKEMYLDSFADEGVQRLWRAAVHLGLIVELHIGPEYAAQVRDVLEAIPETTVLIDHLAEPHMGDAVEYANVLDLARYDRAYMKLSGLGHFAHDPPLYASASVFTRRVVDAFGPERLVWGSGDPAIVDHHMQAYSGAERALVKGGTLARLLELG